MQVWHINVSEHEAHSIGHSKQLLLDRKEKEAIHEVQLLEEQAQRLLSQANAERKNMETNQNLNMLIIPNLYHIKAIK